MDPKQEYFYIPEAMCLVSSDRLHEFKGEHKIQIKDGLKLSDGRTVVDDRVKTPSQLLREGKYDVRKNVLFSNIFHNPLLFL